MLSEFKLAPSILSADFSDLKADIQMVNESEVHIQRCDTSNMVADLFTKGLPRVIFDKHWEVARGRRKPEF